MTNPKDAIDAILETEKNVVGLKVYPLTLGRMALLDLVDSPFINSEKKFTTANLVPTFFIMVQPFKELVGFSSGNIDALIEAAFEWADTQEISDATSLIQAITEKFQLLNRVAPPNTDEKK